MTTVNPADISLRPAKAGDEQFLKRVHRAERHWEFATLLQAGDAELYEKVMEQQYDSQHRSYFAQYDTAQYGIIQWAGEPIGRLYLNYADEEVRVLDIAILPQYRGRGIGRAVLTGICLEAGMRRKPVRLHVHYLSRAARLYERLGFRRLGVHGPTIEMEWRHPNAEDGRRWLQPAAEA